jgi:heme exporter protein A
LRLCPPIASDVFPAIALSLDKKGGNVCEKKCEVVKKLLQRGSGHGIITQRPKSMSSIRIAVENIGKSFGARRVLRGISLEAVSGEVVAVTGANGSGKSTFLKIVAGLIRPSSGTITLTVDDREIAEPDARRRVVSYAGPDLAFYPELTAQENLSFFAEVRTLPITLAGIKNSLVAVGLGGRGDDPVGVYSSGMRQRLRLAFATMLDTPLLLLDEPSLALDKEGVRLVAQTIERQRAKGGVTLLATNDPEEAELGDRAITANGARSQTFSTLIAVGGPALVSGGIGKG